MQELIAYNQWLIKNHDRFFQEYLDTLVKINYKPKVNISIVDVIKFAYDLFNIPENLRNKQLTQRQRHNNDLSLAKGLIINYIIDKNIKGYNIKNIYQKLFNYTPHRTTVYKYLNRDFKNEIPNEYQEFINYIESNIVNWDVVCTKETFFKYLMIEFELNESIFFTNSATYSKTREHKIRGLLVKYLLTNNIFNSVTVSKIFNINLHRGTNIYWKNKKLNDEYNKYYLQLLILIEKYNIIWT